MAIDARVESLGGRVDEAVASGDELAVQIALPRVPLYLQAALAQRLRHVLELVVGVDAGKRPKRERLVACRVGAPLGGQSFGHALRVRDQLGRVTHVGVREARRREGARDGARELGDAGPATAVRDDHGHAEHAFDRGRVRRIVGHLVQHVEGDHERHPELGQLEDQVQVAAQLPGVEHRHA
jgi:hypothetical protein